MSSVARIAPVLALDIGNVCMRIDPQPLLEAIGFASMEAFREFDADGSMWAGIQAFEEGQMGVDDFRVWFCEAVPADVQPSAVDDVWNILLKEEITGVAAVVKTAREAGVKTVFLSDICMIRFEEVRRRLSFFEYVDGAVLSFEVGHHKPHESMYRAMETLHCESRVPLLYADDLEANVAAARTRGWNAHHFRNAEELMADLTESLGRLS